MRQSPQGTTDSNVEEQFCKGNPHIQTSFESMIPFAGPIRCLVFNLATYFKSPVRINGFFYVDKDGD